MQFFDAEQVAENLPYVRLIDALDDAFRSDVTVPPRSHHTVPVAQGSDATLLLMPAWRRPGGIAVKIASVFPDNAKQGIGAINASVLLLDGATGEARAVIDGGELTLRRTACTSALAARYLAPESPDTLLMVGTGSLAPHLVSAHLSVREFERVLIWGRNPAKAKMTASALAGVAANVQPVTDLADGVREAAVICCATLAEKPLIRGEWLQPGQHIDLVGAFTPQTREADSEALRRSRVYVDTYAGAMSESGDVLLAIDEGAISENDLCGELAELARGSCVGRGNAAEITLFKSVGTALEDLVAAELAVANS